MDPVMPVIFIGHGSPMKAIENNEFSRKWSQIGKEIPRSKAILCVSAHWESEGTFVTSTDRPETIHDFGGFPEELYMQQYPAKGRPELADMISDRIRTVSVGKDLEWGLDHGSWCFLKHMYPKADIPVIELSIDYSMSMENHYKLAKELSFLRKEGILLTGSGNIVHNLRMARPKSNNFNEEYGYDWALEYNAVLGKKSFQMTTDR